MMIIRVLPIHVPPCYEGGYLKPLHWKHIWLMMIIWSDPSMFHDAVSPWSLHIYHYEAMQGQGPHFPPTRKATIHIHRGEGGKGVKMGTLHWGGVGGGLAKPGSYILNNLGCLGGSIVVHLCLWHADGLGKEDAVVTANKKLALFFLLIKNGTPQPNLFFFVKNYHLTVRTNIQNSTGWVIIWFSMVSLCFPGVPTFQVISPPFQLAPILWGPQHFGIFLPSSFSI